MSQPGCGTHTILIPGDYVIALSLLLEEAAFFAALSDETAGEAARLEGLARHLRTWARDSDDPSGWALPGGAAVDAGGLEDAIRGWLETGTLELLEQLRRRYPETTREFFLLADLGAGVVRKLLDRGVTSAEELEQRCVSGDILGWREFPEGFANRMLSSLKALRRRVPRIFLPESDFLLGRAVEALRAGGVQDRIEPAGECRRRRELVSRLDLVVENDQPEVTARTFAALGWLVQPSGTADRDVLRARTPENLPVVAHHAPEACFGARLALATGSSGHVCALRRRLQSRGLRLTWQGVDDRRGGRIPCPDEHTLYRLAEWPLIPPELREDRLEWSGPWPRPLITQGDIRGIAHCHTDWTDGAGTLEQMVETARLLGADWLAVTDHSAAAEQANGLSAEKLREQYRAIDRLNASLGGVRVIKGVEADIRADGSVDLGAQGLSASELVIGSVHEGEDGGAMKNTDRVIQAMASGLIDVLGHPSGRILKAYCGRALQWDRVFHAAAAWEVAIEINANPRRLDLDWRLIPEAAALGVWFLIGSDAHRPEGLYNTPYGVALARKGGLGPKRVLNCLDAEKLTAWTQQRRKTGRQQGVRK